MDVVNSPGAKQGLRDFVIASSFPVLALFLWSVSRMPPERRNYTLRQYIFIAPIYMGSIAALFGYLLRDWPISERLLITGIVSGLFVYGFTRTSGQYNFTREEWQDYFVRILMLHVFAFFVMVQVLERDMP